MTSVSSPNAEGKIGFTICDSGLTTDPAERLDLFRKKLGLYAEAITNEDFLRENHPGKTPNDFFIRLASAVRPTAEMLAYTKVMSQGRPDLEIPVFFEEFPEGSWDASVNAASVGEEYKESTGEDDQHNQAMGLLLGKARQIAMTLLDESPPLFVFYLKGEEEALTPITGCQDQAEVDAWLRKWAAAMPDTVVYAIFVALASVEREGQQQPALMFYMHQRSQPESLIGAQPLKKKWLTKKFAVDGGFVEVGTTSNIFPT